MGRAEIDDGMTEGYSHREFAKLLGRAVGRPGALALPVPGFALRLAATVERFRLGDRAKLTPDRVGYFCHPDWVSQKRPPESVWTPKVRAERGLAATADWYRHQGWL